MKGRNEEESVQARVRQRERMLRDRRDGYQKNMVLVHFAQTDENARATLTFD